MNSALRALSEPSKPHPISVPKYPATTRATRNLARAPPSHSTDGPRTQALHKFASAPSGSSLPLLFFSFPHHQYGINLIIVKC